MDERGDGLAPTKVFVDSTNGFVDPEAVVPGEMPVKPSKSQPPRPTPAELEILSVLWEHGPSSVREVQAHLAKSRSSGYTTVLKLLQIMAGKGLVTRDASERSHVYRAAIAREKTQRQLVNDLLERAFGGSASQLIMQALATRRASPQEMAEIRRLLERTGEKDDDRH